MMNLHLAAIAADVAPGRHAVLLLDQAGWHLSHSLNVPNNISIVPLPPKCPELNPQENVWQFMRDKLAIQPRVRQRRCPDRSLLWRL
jgi:transposase